MTDDERIDKVMLEMGNSRNGKLDVQSYLADQLKDEDPLSYQRIRSFIINSGYAKIVINTPLLDILPPGLEISKIGGYLKHLELKREKEEQEKKWNLTREQLDEVNLRLNRFYLKYKWIPFVLSGIAILISIGALVISIIKK